MSEYRPFWIALIVMALLSPVGLYLPALLQAGAAWGEWGLDEVRQMIGYAPAGMQRTAELWQAPLPDYALPGRGEALSPVQGLAYVLSALLGLAACGGGAYLLARWLTRREG